MRYSLARYVGTGTPANPFRPAGTDGFTDWTAIDLRPAGTAVDGYAFLATPNPPPSLAGLVESLGDDLLDLSLANRLLLQSRLGLTLSSTTTLRGHIRDILTDHARTDGTRWRPLAPGVRRLADGRLALAREINLGGERIVDELVASDGPGTTISETFNTADGDTLGPSLAWTEVAGDWDIVANKAQLQAGASLRCAARAESPLASANHSAQVDCDPSGTAAVSDIGVALRFAAAANTYYMLGRQPISDVKRIVKMEAGTGTLIASAAYTDDDANHTVYGSVNGSSLRLLIDGANELTATDTAITGNLRAGISGIRLPGVTTDFDNFTAADLTTSVAGGQATETDTPNAGAAAQSRPGTRADETDTASAGSPTLRLTGAQTEETDTPAAGTPATTFPGALGTETDAAASGTPAAAVAGAVATEADDPLAGALVLVALGNATTETEAALGGLATFTVAGAQASEADTAAAGVTSGGAPPYQITTSVGARHDRYRPGARHDRLTAGRRHDRWSSA